MQHRKFVVGAALAFGALVGAAAPVVAQVPQQGVVYNVAENMFGGSPNNSGSGVAVSADGRYVAFDSFASDLVPFDVAGWSDVFVRDTVTGAVVRVSRGVGGAEANEDSFLGDISNDGMVVVFYSYGSNLATPSSTLGRANVYLATLNPWVSTGAPPGLSRLTNADSDSWSPSIGVGPGGVRVCFLSDATNHVTGDTNGMTDVFVKTISASSVTKRVNLRHTGSQTTTGEAYEAEISSDGQYVVYTSDATNLVGGFVPSGLFSLTYFIDIAGAFGASWTPNPICASRTPTGGEPNGDTWSPAVSNVGGYTVYCSDASNLVAADTNGTADVFFKNIASGGPIERVNLNPAGAQIGSVNDLGAWMVDISDSGDPVIAYETDSPGIVPLDVDTNFDVFVRRLSSFASIEIGDAARRGLGAGADTIALSSTGLKCAFFSYDLALPTNGSLLANGPFFCDLNRSLNFLSGGTSPGSTATLRLNAAEDPGLVYVALAAATSTSGIPLSGIRAFPLDFDALLALTLSPTPYWNAVGVVGGAGFADHAVAIPAIPGLTGFTLYVAAATLDAASPDGVRGVTNALPLTII